MRVARIAFLAAALSGVALPGLHLSPARAAGCTASGPDVVCTETGGVRGTSTGAVRAFKGIPYAKPPLGALRFRPPQPAEPWDEIRAAADFGAPCPQLNAARAVLFTVIAEGAHAAARREPIIEEQ